jgi:hypothetical protein
MPTNPIVGARDVLRAISKLQRQHLVKAMAELERGEPELAEYLLEVTTDIFGLLLRTGIAARETRQIHQRLQSLCIVLIFSLLDAMRQRAAAAFDASISRKLPVEHRRKRKR